MPRRRELSAQARLLIGALLEEPRAWQYGYDLSRRTGLKAGTLYPMLIRLCDQGLLRSAWREAEQRGRPPRHVYCLTAQGLAVGRGAAQAAGSTRAAFRPVKGMS
jgi:DNA-binding PadR family transcriptional regulator